MQSALVFLAVLSVLVVVHEFGHFIVARLVGIKVDKFSIGFGPVLFSRKMNGTEFAFSLLPFGGFVKMAGENPGEATGKSDEFASKSSLQKLAVVAAGPLMNAFLAFVLFAVVFTVGQPTLTSKIGKVMEDTPAQTAGLQADDRIVSVNGIAVKHWEDLLAEVRRGEGAMKLSVDRAGSIMEVTLTPKVQEATDVFGKKRKMSFIGVSPSSEMVSIKSSPLEAIGLAASRVWMMSSLIFKSLGMMITGAMPFKDSMTGPIGIFFMTQQAAQMGIVYLLYFMGSLSVSLFVLNLLPVPVLDGGHILFLAIERIKGSPLKESVKEKMTQGGLIALLALMAFVIFQDLSRFSILANIKNFVFHK
jgi:regulator of sigma E protease